jgi:hypothetical protein
VALLGVPIRWTSQLAERRKRLPVLVRNETLTIVIFQLGRRFPRIRGCASVCFIDVPRLSESGDQPSDR